MDLFFVSSGAASLFLAGALSGAVSFYAKRKAENEVRRIFGTKDLKKVRTEELQLVHKELKKSRKEIQKAINESEKVLNPKRADSFFSFKKKKIVTSPPPAKARLVLLFVVPKRIREASEGDILETYNLILEESGKEWADRFYTKEIARLILGMIWDKIKDGTFGAIVAFFKSV